MNFIILATIVQDENALNVKYGGKKSNFFFLIGPVFSDLIVSDSLFLTYILNILYNLFLI